MRRKAIAFIGCVFGGFTLDLGFLIKRIARMKWHTEVNICINAVRLFGCEHGLHPSECQTRAVPGRQPPGRCRAGFYRSGITMSEYQFSVSVQTHYLSEQSDPEGRQYAFAYTLTIRNTGQVPAQLIWRHWIITDSENKTQEVKGLGVIGQQPLLKPGEKFEYTSWALIETPDGTMRGTFFCLTEDCQHFETPVPEFALQMPRTLH
jgi:ApaG protein